MNNNKKFIAKILLVVGGLILFFASAASLLDLPTKMGWGMMTVTCCVGVGFIVMLLGGVIGTIYSDGKGNLVRFVAFALPFSIFLLLGVASDNARTTPYFNQQRLEKNQAEGRLPKGDVAIINKVIWNDVEVSWKEGKVQKEVAMNLFKVQFEKYEEKLKFMKILTIVDDEQHYLIICGLHDGSEVVDTIKK